MSVRVVDDVVVFGAVTAAAPATVVRLGVVALVVVANDESGGTGGSVRGLSASSKPAVVDDTEDKT